MPELSLNRYLSPEQIGAKQMPRSPHISANVSGNVTPLSSHLSPNLTANLTSVCQRQVAQLVEQLPLLGAWIVYRDGSGYFGQRHRVKVVCERRSGFDLGIVSELESEVWLPQSGDLHDTSLEHIPENIYVYPLRSRSSRKGNVLELTCGSLNTAYSSDQEKSSTREAALDEYLLLWSATTLSVTQQQRIKQRVQLLDDYLRIGRDWFRQQEEIELLEQAIGKAEHQLRNYLATIGLYAQNLNWGLSDPNLKEQATVIQDTAREISANLTQLLNCNKLNKIHYITENFLLVVEKIIQILTPKISANNIQINYPQQPLRFTADFWQIQQAFENVLNNAIDFSPCGGTVTCEWQAFRNEVLIKISDRGSGFSNEDLQNAFTPYYSKREGGTGLGLAIAKKIILDHRGSIWLENLPSGGAQVSVILPRYAQS